MEANDIIPHREEEFVNNPFAHLMIASDDPCRKYFSTMFQFMNSCEFDLLSLYLHSVCSSDFQAVVKRDIPILYIADRKTKKIAANGVAPFVQLLSEVARCLPDRTYTIKETILRNRANSTIIMSQFTVVGTLVFQINSNSANVRHIKNDEIVIDNAADFHPKKQLVGGEDSPIKSYECTGTLTLNRERKILRLLFDYTKDRNNNWVGFPADAV